MGETNINNYGSSSSNRVCVTGAGGFIASWLIKLLLSEGYTVHGTFRSISGDEKTTHLENLKNAAEKLKLFNAELLDFDSILCAVKGCDGVFHVASPVTLSPVPNPEVEIVKPALDGTLNVLKACSEAKVKRVVVVSSIGAIYINPNWPKGEVMDENCWSDREYCKTTNNWYCYSKTLAESAALEYAKRTGLDVVTLCPTLVLGPMLQQTVNTSTLVLIKLLKEGYEELENNTWMMVDVRDVAKGLILVYEEPEAEGRYLCVADTIEVRDVVEILRKIYPNYNYPKSFKEGTDMSKSSSQKLQNLGWKYRTVEETLVDSVDNYKKAGLLDF